MRKVAERNQVQNALGLATIQMSWVGALEIVANAGLHMAGKNMRDIGE
jgi:hypothetical protein